MTTKLNYKRTFFIGLAFLSISAFWQVYDNIIPLIMQNSFGMGETITGVIMALDNVLALILLPVFGMLSDKVNTGLGKRMPFIITGTILVVGFMMVLPAADNNRNQWLFVAALFMTLLSMGLYRAPAVALMPDLTPNHLRSRANAVINLMGAVGGVYSLIMIKILVGEGNTPDYFSLFFSVAALMVISIGILTVTIKENRIRREMKFSEEANIQTVQNTEKQKQEQTVLAKEVKRSMIFMLLSVFLWYMAYNAVTTAFSRYTKVVWKLEGGNFADCLMVATIAAIISYIPIGSISARFGRKKTIIGGVWLMAGCYGVAIFVGEYHPLINIAFAIIGMAWAAINVNSYPMIVEMSKGGDLGKFTGTYYTFSMAAQIITPVLSGVLLENVSYRILFPYALAFSLLALFTMTQVQHGDVRPEKRKSLLENFDIED